MKSTAMCTALPGKWQDHDKNAIHIFLQLLLLLYADGIGLNITYSLVSTYKLFYFLLSI